MHSRKHPQRLILLVAALITYIPLALSPVPALAKKPDESADFQAAETLWKKKKWVEAVAAYERYLYKAPRCREGGRGAFQAGALP